TDGTSPVSGTQTPFGTGGIGIGEGLGVPATREGDLGQTADAVVGIVGRVTCLDGDAADLAEVIHGEVLGSAVGIPDGLRDPALVAGKRRLVTVRIGETGQLAGAVPRVVHHRLTEVGARGQQVRRGVVDIGIFHLASGEIFYL